MRDMSVAIPGASEVTTTSGEEDPPWLQVRREPFEHGLLPLPNLVHYETVGHLRALREKLLEHSFSSPQCHSANDVSVSETGQLSALLASSLGKRRVGTAGIAASIGISETHAQLLLDTLASILPNEELDADLLAKAPVDEIESVGADVDDILLFLYLQIYRKVPPRPHKDAAAVADIWPSTSAFDGFLPALSPLQVRPSRRCLPGQAEEEAHQLAFVQKHLPMLLSLLSDIAEEDGLEVKVLTPERFTHLSLLFRVRELNGSVVPLNQAAPFFANSDPDMPAAAVPLPQVLDWLSQHIYSCPGHAYEKSTVKENGPVDHGALESDITMVDASMGFGSTSVSQSGILPNGPARMKKERLIFVDGLTRTSTLKTEADIRGGTVKVTNCHDSMVYCLAPLKYATVSGCSDSIVVLGAVGKAVRVEHCERVQLIVPCARICIANCRECVFFLGVNQRPVIYGNNHNLQVAPYNTFYPRLEAHLVQTGVDPHVNKWDKILTLGAVDSHDSLHHPAGITDAQAEGATLVLPDRFTNFMIPRWDDEETDQQLQTHANPFVLPKNYLLAQEQRGKAVEHLRSMLKNVPLDEARKRELSHAIHANFKEWLYASGNIRQLYDFQGSEKETREMD